MNWVGLLQNLGTFAIASGLLVWLFRVLVQQSLSRDLEAFKAGLKRAHEIEMEEAKNRFTVGATSHMANVAFDKHVQFCEEYTKAVNDALATLFRRGPNADVLQNANALMDLRIKYSVWLTPAIETQLVKFEGALRKIGANAWLLGELREDRDEAVQEAFGTFAAIMGWENWRGKAVTRDVAAEGVIEGLRDVLGISELTRLRTELLNRATDNLRKSISATP